MANLNAGSSPVNSATIVDDSIVDADVNSAAAIAQTKLGATTGDVVKASGSAATAIQNLAVTTATINTNAVTLAKLATQAANTYLANNTVGAAVPSAVAMPYVLDPLVTNTTVLGWSCAVEACHSGGTFTPNAATIYLVKVPVPLSITITNVGIVESTAGTNYTNAQMGLWSSAGTYLSSTAVQASGGTNGFGAAAPATVLLPLAASQPITGGPTVFVWVGVHLGTNSATAVQFRGAPTIKELSNAGTSTTTLRTASYVGHATNNLATIGNLTPSSMTSSSNFGFMYVT